MPDNYGLSEISTIEDATAAWQSFFGRFFSPEIPPGVDVTFDPKLRVFAPRENKNAKYKHPGFIDPKTKQYPVDPQRTLHSDDFDDFLNGNKITIPAQITLNAKGLEQVAQALARGDFEDEALKKEDHTFYALWLFKQNKITRQQMSTILAREQFTDPLKTFPILDEAGEFTKEAQELWLPTMRKKAYGENLTDWHLERLRLLIKALPKSEQIFYLSEYNPYIIAPIFYVSTLGNALQRLGAWYSIPYNQQHYDLHMSFGVIEALQIAQHGINHAAASRAKIGTIGIDAVKEGVESYYRPTAISMRNSGVEATTKGIHEYRETPMPTVTAHDSYHAKLHSSINPEFHMMLNHMHQIIFKHTKQKWSKTTWELVDREFHAFRTRKVILDSPKDGAKFFQELLHRDNSDKARLFRNYNPPRLSDDGFAIVWNMVTQSDVWKNLYKIDIDSLEHPYRKEIQKIRTFIQMAGSDHKYPEILTLKYRLFSATSNAEFKKICKLLDSLEEQLIVKEGQKVTDQEQKLVFGKHTQNNIKNLTILKFKNFGQSISIDESSARQLIPMLVNMQLLSKFGEKNTEKVQTELDKISAGFKEKKQHHFFSKAQLNASLATFASMTEKLDFLEACYEKIIESTKHTQRHATIGKALNFFKNPLSTTQRKHIILLKEKLDELVTAYKQGLNNEEERKELQWYMKNRGSNLALCHTERFYMHLDATVPAFKK
ncbi:hypothetical protein [Legionella cherrii]|uniref:Coiled-coil protein n=1 Tax=Legionella cherrii TaxID=28084 RepID=A0ABY6T1D1_9GAMM|nr:hypothetical protein [Legionella cherrii]VEB32680.1 Uncharacterised protein [Legionella cherrii]